MILPAQQDTEKMRSTTRRQVDHTKKETPYDTASNRDRPGGDIASSRRRWEKSEEDEMMKCLRSGRLDDGFRERCSTGLGRFLQSQVSEYTA